MTVKELRDLLAAYPDDMPVVTSFHSDYIDLPPPAPAKFVKKQSYWENYHERQYPPDKQPQITEVVYFEGN